MVIIIYNANSVRLNLPTGTELGNILSNTFNVPNRWFQAISLLSWVGGRVGVEIIRHKANSVRLDYPTGTELGNNSDLVIVNDKCIC